MATSKSLEAVATTLVALSATCKFNVKNIKVYEVFEGSDLVVGRKYWLPKDQYIHSEKFKGTEYGAYFTVDASGRKGKISAKSFNRTYADSSCKTLQAQLSNFVSSNGNKYWCPCPKGHTIRLWEGEFPIGLVQGEGTDAFLSKDLYFEVTGKVKVSIPVEVQKKGKTTFEWTDEKALVAKTQKIEKLTYRVITKEEFYKK